MKTLLLLTAVIFFAAAEFHSFAAELVSDRDIRASVSKAIPLLEAGAKGSMEKRKQCFTCHNQGLPIMALTAARARGFPIDEGNLARQLEFTAEFLARNRTNYLAGKGQGGAALTAGYALWTLDNGGWKPDLTTSAVTDYLLTRQSDLDHWEPQTLRPPTEESLFAITYVALRGLKSYGTIDQQARILARIERVRSWLLNTKPQSTEDRVFKVRALELIGEQDEKQSAADYLLATQQKDGGWAQLADMKSDAYATATALATLHQAGALAPTNSAYQRGLRWLLNSQLPDGSWHVQTRSKPIQVYYESGYPHGEDQFISITAAGWAVTALSLALSKP